ncbi:MAG: c-type cytochrome [Gammaproteobacteria bacterium]|nr:c-type cytochrome [Gammaproteobacteria bacterium]
MNTNARRILLIGIGLVVLVLIFAIAATFYFMLTPRSGDFFFSQAPLFRNFDSNGERIYFTGTSRTGPPITFEMGGMNHMGPRRMACADCHGTDGRGGRVAMMMTSIQAPDIRYHTLTEGEHDDDHGDEEHPAYTDETIQQAVTMGINPAGERLDWIMPRWDMTDEQFEDLLNYLKTLE